MNPNAPNAMQRREFLKSASAGLVGMSALPGLSLARRTSAAASRPALVVLYLRGGVDALSVLIPHREKRYRELRPTLALEDAPALDDEFLLHPALRDLLPFWKAKTLAPILCVGSHHPTRSHFDAQDFMEYGAPGQRNLRNGWLNRYLSETHERFPGGSAAEGGLRALAVQGLLPRALRGDYPVLAVPERHVLADRDMLELFGRLYGTPETPPSEAAEDAAQDSGQDTGDPMQREDSSAEAVRHAGHSTLEALARFQEVVDAGTPGEVTYPGTQLGRRLATVARLLRSDADLEVAAMDLVGWDTHTAQGAVEGDLPELLGDLGSSLAAFLTDLGPHLERTLVLVMSEFGRTCAENGNYGTDHGHGGVFLLAGGGVEGGQVHGRWNGLEDSALHHDRDLPVHTDFRDVFAEVLRSHLDFDLPRGFFPDHRPTRLRNLF